jgi:hypothetical protein
VQSAASNERNAFAHASLLHFGDSIAWEPVVLAASSVLDPLISKAFLAGDWTSCGLLFSEADCRVGGSMVSRAGIGGTADARGFDKAGEAAAEGWGEADKAGGVAGCACCWVTGSPYFIPRYPANAALAPKRETSSASERRFMGSLLKLPGADREHASQTVTFHRSPVIDRRRATGSQ